MVMCICKTSGSIYKIARCICKRSGCIYKIAMCIRKMVMCICKTAMCICKTSMCIYKIVVCLCKTTMSNYAKGQKKQFFVSRKDAKPANFLFFCELCAFARDFFLRFYKNSYKTVTLTPETREKNIISWVLQENSCYSFSSLAINSSTIVTSSALPIKIGTR